MEAKELRVGNLLNYCDQEVIVLSVSSNGRKDFDVELGYFTDSIGFERKLSDSDISPILLTEEWLVRFGFDMDDSVTLCKDIPSIDTNERVLFLYWDAPHDEVWLLDEEHNYEICSVQKVHQLQNLYFALTGKELEFDKS